jgi:hypothetical protein
MLVKVLADQEEERLEEERKAAEEEQVDVASKEGSQAAKTKTSPKPSERDLMNNTQCAANSGAMLTDRHKMEDTARATEANRPASDFGMVSSQHDGTAFSQGRSQMKSSLQMQRVYEITDFEKAKRWPRMLAAYYKSGMQEFNLLRHQR